MDTAAKRRRRWAIEIKRKIAEESFAGSASVAQLGQKYAVNANQIFLWRKQYREGRLDNNTSTKLLPVTVSKEVVVSAANPAQPIWPGADRNSEDRTSQRKSADCRQRRLGGLRTALECLLG